MADSYTPYLNLRKPEVGAARDNWGSIPGLNGDLDIIDGVFAPGGDGTPVGINIGTGQVADARAGTLLVTADRLELTDASDPTKLAHILLTALAPGAENNYFLPPLVDELVGMVNVQNLSNKTADDPPGGVIDNSQALASAHWVQAVISAVVAALPPPPEQYVSTGDIIASAAAAKAGWVKLIGGTIGNTGSLATLADPTAQDLFNLFWAINGGTWVINGGRGASAAADWASLRTITLPDASGMALVGIGGAVALATLFATAGEATHVLTVAEMPAHTHPAFSQTPLASFAFGGAPINGEGGNTGSTGGGGAHNNVQPSMGVVYWMKL